MLKKVTVQYAVVIEKTYEIELEADIVDDEEEVIDNSEFEYDAEEQAAVEVRRAEKMDRIPEDWTIVSTEHHTTEIA